MTEEQARDEREYRMHVLTSPMRIKYQNGDCSLSELIDHLIEVNRTTPYEKVTHR